MFNRFSKETCASYSAIIFAGAACIGVCPVHAAATDAETQSSAIEDIVVTAQKREQNLQSVPVSITALNSDAIKANRIASVYDLNAVAPNLTVRLGAGGALVPNYTLRGILTGGTAVGTDKGVSLYIDGVYIQNVTGSIFDIADIERIEVLRGPQGTLFGRNATGGAISFTTKNPTGVFAARQELTYGNYAQLRSKTHVDLPSFGPLSASFTYLHSERRGDTRNLGAGTIWDYGPATGGQLGKRTSPKYLGNENVEAVQAALKLDLIPDLEMVYKFDLTQNHFSPQAQGVAYLTTGNIIDTLYRSSPNAMTPVSRKRPSAVNNAFSTPGIARTSGHNLTTKFKVTDQIELKNIFSMRKSYLETTFQLDGLGGLANSPVSFSGLGQPGVVLPASFIASNPNLRAAPTTAPFNAVVNTSRTKERQWSEELQINIDTDGFNLTAGYLHFHDNIQGDGFDGLFGFASFVSVNGQQTSLAGTPFVIPRNPGYQNSLVSINSDAFFVQQELHLTSRLDVVGGARITRDRKQGRNSFPDQFLAGNTTSLNYVSVPVDYKSVEANFLASINYHPADHILTYAKYADGYISGGRLATIPFSPERAYSFEVGVKADLFDRRFRTNVAIFDVDYKSIQYTTAGSLTQVPAAALFGGAVIASADAHAKGFEWENTVIPLAGLTLTGNVGFTDFKFDQTTVFPGFALASGAPGYKEFQRPKWTGSFSAQYEGAEVLAGGHLVLRTDANFLSKMLLTSDIAPGTGLTVRADPALVTAASTPFQWLVNARVALAGVELGRTIMEVAFWGRNVFNNRNPIQFVGLDLGPIGSIGAVTYERARTYGLDLSITF